jgi:hypothetical protein
MPADHDIAELLRGLGYGTTSDQAQARAALEARGLTRAGKARISDEKLLRVRQALDADFAVLCGNPLCAAAVARGRLVIRATPLTLCAHCGGSDNKKAFLRLEALAARARVSKLVIVGGSPSVREELRALSPASWQLRLVDGTERRTSTQAAADLEWADLVMVWGGSELDHKVSKLYTDAPPPLRKKIIQLAKRGVAALLHAAADHLER